MNNGDYPTSKTRACLVIPTYNEAGNIGPLIEQCQMYASSIPSMDFHVLVVDDNSPDGTANIVRTIMDTNHNVHLVTRQKKMGLGSAIVFGYAHAEAELDPDIFIQMDADFSHPPEILPEIVSKVMDGYDVGIASRYLQGGGSDGWPFHRRMISRSANFLARFFLGLPVNDTTGEYRALSKRAALTLVNSKMGSRGYDYCIESLLLLKKSGCSMSEVPFVFKQRKTGKAKLSITDILVFGGRIAKLSLQKPTPTVTDYS